MLKVSKSQKQISKFSFEPKTVRFFCISALASKMSQSKKSWLIIMLISDYLTSNIIIWFFFNLTHFRVLGQKYKNIFLCFLVQMKTLKFAFWDLLTFTQMKKKSHLHVFLPKYMKKSPNYTFICNQRDMTYRSVRDPYDVIRFVSMTSLCWTAAPNCRTGQSKGRYRAHTVNPSRCRCLQLRAY